MLETPPWDAVAKYLGVFTRAPCRIVGALERFLLVAPTQLLSAASRGH